MFKVSLNWSLPSKLIFWTKLNAIAVNRDEWVNSIYLRQSSLLLFHCQIAKNYFVRISLVKKNQPACPKYRLLGFFEIRRKSMSLVYFIEFNQNIKNDLFMVWLFVENFPQTFNKTSCIHDDRARLWESTVQYCYL